MAQACVNAFDTTNINEGNNEKFVNDVNRGSFRFNAGAAEFVPRMHVPVATEDQVAVPVTMQVPMTAYYYPCFQYVDAANGSWIYVAAQETTTTVPLVEEEEKLDEKSSETTPTDTDADVDADANKQEKVLDEVKEIVISNELKQKIIKQAEYMFSDMSMLANESFAKHVLKDPEGFVPINFVSTTKKLKNLSVNNQMAAQALQDSTKLVVSSDGKKVRRKQIYTEKEKEELQLRTVIVENLPDDHSHQNIEKLFNVVGSIKAIRICQPHDHHSSRDRSSKGDLVVSNKLHALVQYETPETAEKAAEKLNDERNWRKGMRVRVMLKRSPKSVLKLRKSEFDGIFDDVDDGYQSLSDASPRLSSCESSEGDENSVTPKKSWVRNRGKSKQRPLQTARSLPTPSTHSMLFPGEVSARQPTVKGPRMPDGTRGFTMGRGKPLALPVQSS